MKQPSPVLALKARNWLRAQHWLVFAAGVSEESMLDQLGAFRFASGLEARWAEVAVKTHPTLYQRTGRWQHGISSKRWASLLEVQRLTGLPGDLAIVQLRPGPDAPEAPAFLFAALQELGTNVRINVEVGMVYWDADRFERYPIDGDVPQPDLRRPRVVRPWEAAGQDGAPQLGERQLGLDV